MKKIDCDYISDIASPLLRRNDDTHKGDYGRILIYAGSSSMTGAAVLCGRSALKSGSGLVYFYAPEEIFPVLQNAVTEGICIKRQLKLTFDDYSAIAAGPGLDGSIENEICLLKEILTNYSGKLVLDAEALNIIAVNDMEEEVRRSSADIVITPHPGEASRLLGHTITDRYDAVNELVEKYGVTVVLKGNGTLVMCEGGEMLINTTGNPGMATAGSGDVLTGMIAAMAGQGLGVYEAAAAGVYLHGAA